MRQIWLENMKSSFDEMLVESEIQDVFTNEEILEYVVNNFSAREVLVAFGYSNYELDQMGV